MAKNTKFMRTEREAVVTSRQRAPEQIKVPVFNYQGRLRAGLSTEWPVIDKMELVAGTITASGAGTQTAGFAVMKRTPFGEEPLKSFTLGSGETAKSFFINNYLRPAILYPGDFLYIASFRDSRHRGVAIQLFAHRIL